MKHIYNLHKYVRIIALELFNEILFYFTALARHTYNCTSFNYHLHACAFEFAADYPLDCRDTILHWAVIPFIFTHTSIRRHVMSSHARTRTHMLCGCVVGFRGRSPPFDGPNFFYFIDRKRRLLYARVGPATLCCCVAPACLHSPYDDASGKPADTYDRSYRTPEGAA